MALFGQFGGFINNALKIFSRAGGAVGGAAQLGQTALTSFLPAQGPIVGFGGADGVAATPVMATALRLPSLAGALAVTIQPILIRVATFLGRKTLTLRETIKIIRRFTKFLPAAAIATVLGITVNELGQLILADAQRPRRRMNVANVKALRRSMRRLEGFHRLCVRADTLRRPGRRASRLPATRPAVQVVRAG